MYDWIFWLIQMLILICSHNVTLTRVVYSPAIKLIMTICYGYEANQQTNKIGQKTHLLHIPIIIVHRVCTYLAFYWQRTCVACPAGHVTRSIESRMLYKALVNCRWPTPRWSHTSVRRPLWHPHRVWPVAEEERERIIETALKYQN